MSRLGILLKSKTMWGSLATAVAWLLAQPHVGGTEVVQAIGGVVTAIGVRDAIGQVQQAQTDATPTTKIVVPPPPPYSKP